MSPSAYASTATVEPLFRARRTECAGVRPPSDVNTTQPSVKKSKAKVPTHSDSSSLRKAGEVSSSRQGRWRAEDGAPC